MDASPDGLVEIEVTVNGVARELAVQPRWLLSDVLRHELQLTGTHVGCEHGVCGCCTVLLDGDPVRSCLLFGIQADGAEVTTVEGLEGPDGALHPLQEAFSRHHALQCGFCTPGFLIGSLAIYQDAPELSDEQLREAIGGQLCRCTGYVGILDAIRDAGRCARAAGRET